MRVIGLTGSIACGKSNVSSALRELGAAIVDGDEIAHALTAPGGAALPLLREAFGDGVFREDGTLDRKALGAVVFGDAAARQRLDDLMQPPIRQETLRQMEAARHEGRAACVLDMPLLFEKGLETLCDSVWSVWIPRETQLERLMARDGCPREAAEARVASQLSADEKAARADVVIDTSGTAEETRARIPALYQKELEDDPCSSHL